MGDVSSVPQVQSMTEQSVVAESRVESTKFIAFLRTNASAKMDTSSLTTNVSSAHQIPFTTPISDNAEGIVVLIKFSVTV